MSKKKISKLLRHEFFYIKTRFLLWRLNKHLIQRNHSIARQLACLLDMATLIHVPSNDEEKCELEWVCNTYDSLIDELQENMNQSRRWIS